MRKIKKIVIAITTGVVIFNTFNVSACASAAVYNTGDVCVPYADEIELKWRVSNGVLQYRHWNATRNRWVESKWIDYKYGEDPISI